MGLTRGRLAEASCDGVMSGIPGWADLFFLRVFIDTEGVAEGEGGRAIIRIRMGRCWDGEENAGSYSTAWCNVTWSISVDVVVAMEHWF